MSIYYTPELKDGKGTRGGKRQFFLKGIEEKHRLLSSQSISLVMYNLISLNG